LDSLDRLTESCFWTLKLFFKLLQAVFGQKINVMEIRANCNKALYLSVKKCNPSAQEQALRVNLERIKGDMIMKKKGFTLVELLVVIAIIALLMGILMPALARVRQIANRMVCGSNLSGIGKAILIYANDYEDEFPNAARAPRVKWATNGRSVDYDAVERIAAYSPNFSTITASLFLLVKYADVTCKQFICKGDIGVEEFKLDQDPLCEADEITQCWDFGLNPGQHESYSYHTPYKQSGEADAAFPLNTQSSPSSPLCADRNPFLTVSLQTSNEVEPPEWTTDGGGEYYDPDNLANSGSHQRDGQNVLYVDMHVKFEKKTNVGIENDNIWGWWSDGTTSSSITPEDRETGMEFPEVTGDGGGDEAGLVEKDAYLVHEMDKTATAG